MSVELTKATGLLGPDGEPIRTITSRVASEVVDEEVGKVVRHQGTTLTSVWDRHRGKPKPSPVTWQTLRMMANRNEWVRAIIKTRKNQIGATEWAFQPPDDADTIGPALQRLMDRMTRLFKRPSLAGSRPHSRSWRHFIGEVLEDLLVLDAGSIEKERTRAGWIAAMYPVDGATIRPNIDEYGGFYNPDSYVQLVDGQVTARFGLEDLVYIMDNPLTDVRFAGYGYSPLESLIVSVTAELYASKYQSSYFEKGSVPEGILNLGEDVAPEDVDAFRLYWMNEVMGKPWAIPIVGGKGVEWQPWRASNKDMEYMQYQQWLLKKICAVYQIPPQEIGELEDVNRTTANEQADVNQSKSVQPILTLLKDYIDVEIVGEHGNGIGEYLEFAWVEEGEGTDAIIQKYATMIPMGAATRREFRDEMGMETPDEDTIGSEGLEMFLVDGSPSPLPSHEDAHQMGAAAQAEQQAQMGGPPGGPQFADADMNHPAVQEAMQAHADEAGAPAMPPGGGGGMPPQFQKTHEEGDVEKADFEGHGHEHDRDPALTAREDAMARVWDRQQKKLVDGLAEILTP